MTRNRSVREITEAAAAALDELAAALRTRAQRLENLDDTTAEEYRRRSEAATIDAAALRRSLPR
jgi:hypothetical protein